MNLETGNEFMDVMGLLNKEMKRRGPKQDVS